MEEIEDVVKQGNKLQWYGHVLRKHYDDWVKECNALEVERARQG